MNQKAEKSIEQDSEVTEQKIMCAKISFVRVLVRNVEQHNYCVWFFDLKLISYSINQTIPLHHNGRIQCQQDTNKWLDDQ